MSLINISSKFNKQHARVLANLCREGSSDKCLVFVNRTDEAPRIADMIEVITGWIVASRPGMGWHGDWQILAHYIYINVQALASNHQLPTNFPQECLIIRLLKSDS